MGNSTQRLRTSGLVAVAAVALLLAGGCATSLRVGYDYFAAPAPDDPWSRKIRGWQARERADAHRVPDSPAAVAGPPGEGAMRPASGEGLRSKYASFRAERRRAMAREVAAWIQEQAREHYRADGPIDHWATLEETLAANGDDCDGLELLVYDLLLDLGFEDDEVFRSIVYRRSDGQHHMVTLWFEDRDDPWVIDPTGAMTSGMPRMSEVAGWEALKVFTRDRDFTVERRFAAHDASTPSR